MSIKVTRLDSGSGIWPYAGKDHSYQWEPCFLMFCPTSFHEEKTMNFGKIKTSKSFGYSDKACNHLGADGYACRLPDSLSFRQVTIPGSWGDPDEVWTQLWSDKREACLLKKVILPVNIRRQMSARWVCRQNSYYSDDWTTELHTPVYLGAKVHSGWFELWFENGSYERWEVRPKAKFPQLEVRLIWYGEVVYSTIEDMEHELSKEDGWFWMGHYRVRDFRIDGEDANPWQDFPTTDILANEDLSSFKLSESDMNDAKVSIDRRVRAVEGFDPFEQSETISKNHLTWLSLDNIRYLSINSLAFIEDLMKLKETLVPIIRLVRRPLDPKAWANLWLSYRYGLRLTIHDALQIRDAYDAYCKRKRSDRPFSTVRSRLSDDISAGEGYKSTVHQKVYYRSTVNAIEDFILLCRRWDLYPSWENIWDLIPLSFVVDWFIDVTTFLTKFDKRNDLDRLPVEYVLYSSKTTSGSGVPEVRRHLFLQLSVKHYRRWRELNLPSPVKPPERHRDPNVPFRILDGISLVVQRTR